MKNTKTTYASNKAVARQEAIDWQNNLFRDNRSYEELAEATEHFEKLGKRYGLAERIPRKRDLLNKQDKT